MIHTFLTHKTYWTQSSSYLRRAFESTLLNLGIIENTSTGRLIFTIFSAFADFERDLIVERTQEGKELAKQKPDFREGRPKKFNQQQINLAMNLLKNHSYKEVEKMTGISKSTLTRNNRKMQNKPQIGV